MYAVKRPEQPSGLHYIRPAAAEVGSFVGDLLKQVLKADGFDVGVLVYLETVDFQGPFYYWSFSAHSI
jgi:hypothetical protein